MEKPRWTRFLRSSTNQQAYRLDERVVTGDFPVMKLFIFLVLLPLTCFSSATKIFSMNLHCGSDDWKARLDVVVGEILRIRPEVIGLQEVCYNDEMNMAGYIREKLLSGGYGFRTFETLDTHRSFLRYQEQLVLISKLPVDEVKSGFLPSSSLLRNGYIAVRSGQQWYLTTHLNFILPMVRKNQFNTLSKSFGKNKAIIFGDFNSGPEDDEAEVMKKGNWVSAFDGPTFPAENPEKTFDGFWMSSSFHDEVMATTVELHFLNARFQPSDHLGISLNILSK